MKGCRKLMSCADLVWGTDGKKESEATTGICLTVTYIFGSHCSAPSLLKPHTVITLHGSATYLLCNLRQVT